MRVLHRLEGGEGIGKEEEFMWRGKERDERGRNRWQVVGSPKYGGRVPEAVVGDDAIHGRCVACSGS